MVDTNRSGYLRMPTIHGNWIVFTAEDDLWRVRVPAAGGPAERAERLTAGVAEATDAHFSPDGTRLAFTGCDEGPNEVYVMPAEGGPATRLTYLGGDTQVVGWRDDQTIVFRSNAGQPMEDWMALFEVDRGGGEPRPLRYGVAHTIAYGPGGAIALGRHTIEDRLHWKGYRGGLGGQIWVDSDGSGDFTRILADLSGHITCPCWVGDRIYFLSNHEGSRLQATANVYSCRADGTDCQRHTHHTRCYARNLSTDGQRLVFQAGGDLYLLEPGARGSTQVAIELPGPRTQRARKFVAAAGYLDRESRTAALHPGGRHIALIARGKALALGIDGGVVIQLGDTDGTRYRLPAWLPDGRRLVAIADPSGFGYAEPRLVELRADGGTAPREMPGLDIGRVLDLVPSPRGDRVALTNHRYELVVVDLEAGSAGVVDRNAYAAIAGVAWSPDGETLAYGYALDAERTAIKLCRVDTGETCLATDPVFRDTDPAFDPGGEYLYFLGVRDYNQALGPGGAWGRERPYAVPLRRGGGSPFVPMPRPFVEDASHQAGQSGIVVSGLVAPGGDDPGTDNPHQPRGPKHGPCARVAIHAGGISERAIAFPVAPGSYDRVIGIRGGVVYSRGGGLYVYDFARRHEAAILKEDVGDFAVAAGGTILVRSHGGLLVVGVDDRLAESDAAALADHAVRLDRIAVAIRPDMEWRQMYFDAWRLQRDYFWRGDMNGVAWEAMRDRYAPLLDRIASRGDLADVIWELQGELRASHAFAFGGDYRQEADDAIQGCLGVEWSDTYDAAAGGYRIIRIVRGDPWNAGAPATTPLPGDTMRASSPLLALGLEIRTGDALAAVDGQPVTPETGPGQLLVNKAGREVELVIRSAARGARRARRLVTVRALFVAEERGARYRDWVEANRRRVSAATGGRVGYLHIPDMVDGRVGNGLAEFLRGYRAQFDREGLIVDVRWNSGGHISPDILDWLTRERIGASVHRRGLPDPLPYLSPRGPMVALVNELTASDGEIFSHLFRALGLGPLIGMRTWGGVIGITHDKSLADGTVPTQPAGAIRFTDVGFEIENRGVDPVADPARDRDKQVDIAPQDYRRGADPQLERAIVEALRQIAAHTMRTPLPDAANQDDDHRRAG